MEAGSMDPFFAKNRLSAYLDGQLSSEESAEVRRALEEDADLRAEFKALEATVALLRKHGPAAAPAGFHDRVMAQVGGQRTGRLVVLRQFLRQIPVEAVALAAAAVLVIAIVGNPTDNMAGSVLSPPPVEVKGGAAAPQARIEPSQDLNLPLSVPEPAEKKEAPTPRKETSSATDTSPALQKVVVEPPPEVYVAEWEQQDTTGTVQTRTDGSGSAELDEITDTPRELYGGLSAETATPYQYRISHNDAQVLFSLQQLAQSTGGRLLDSDGGALNVAPLNVEQNYVRVQLVVPPGQAAEVHTWLKGLGATASLPESGSPLYGADYVAFLIEVTYMP
jgi:hypothetical protein